MEIKRYDKESNPEALINNQAKQLPYISGNIKGNKIDLFAPRGDHAKDAFDKDLFDMLNDTLDYE